MSSVLGCYCDNISERLNFELSIKHRVLAAAVVQQQHQENHDVIGTQET